MSVKRLLALSCLVGTLLSTEASHALPGGGMRLSRSGTSRNEYRNNRYTNRIDSQFYRNNVNSTAPSYTGMTRHEMAAAQQKQAEKDYQDKVQAIKEGRYVGPQTTGVARDREALRQQIEENRMKHEQVLIERRMAREEELAKREKAYFARTRKGMEQDRKSKTQQRNEHKDVDPVKLNEELKPEAEVDGLKNF